MNKIFYKIYLIALVYPRVICDVNNDNEECGIEFRPSGKIFNGKEASEFQTPWKAALFKKENYICGGVIIKMDIVLTAAHCLHNKGSELIEIEDLTIILGALDLNETEEIRRQTRKASKFTIHQDWSVTTSKYNDDIAIIKLKDPVNYTIFVRPICLWKSDLNDFQNIPSVGTVSGWGATEIYGGFVNKARIVEVPILELTKCLLEKDLINRIAWNKSFCAGNDNFGVLRGDSGSALTLKIGEKNYLKGLVSSSISVPSKASFLAVYADVTLYDDFIKGNTNQIPINIKCNVSYEAKYGFYDLYGCTLDDILSSDSVGNFDIKINNEHEGKKVEIFIIKSYFIIFPRNFIFDSFPFLKVLSIQFAIPKNDPYQVFYLTRKHFQEFRNIETLFIHSKFEGNIPEDLFFDLVKVKNLRMRFNNFHELPRKLLSKMLNLNVLYLGNNKIEKITSDFFIENSKLEHLYLSNNKIEFLDEKLLESLENLSKLEISKNKIKNLPEKIFSKCRELKYLDMSHNQIENLPKNLFEHNYAFRTLILTSNKISKIFVEPKVFSHFSRIEINKNDCVSKFFIKGHDEQIIDFERRIEDSLKNCL